MGLGRCGRGRGVERVERGVVVEDGGGVEGVERGVEHGWGSRQLSRKRQRNEFLKEACLGPGPKESTPSLSCLKKKMQSHIKHSSRKPHCSTFKVTENKIPGQIPSSHPWEKWEVS